MGRVRKLNDSERKSIVSMFPQLGVTAVSYTHLTLPTNREV